MDVKKREIKLQVGLEKLERAEEENKKDNDTSTDEGGVRLEEEGEIRAFMMEHFTELFRAKMIDQDRTRPEEVAVGKRKERRDILEEEFNMDELEKAVRGYVWEKQ